jgi:uncharacterized membrane protein
MRRIVALIRVGHFALIAGLIALATWALVSLV